MNIIRYFEQETSEILKLVCLGLSDKKSNFSVLTQDKLFDKNVTKIIQDFFITEFSVSLYRENYKIRPIDVVFNDKTQELYVLENNGNISVINTRHRKWIGRSIYQKNYRLSIMLYNSLLYVVGGNTVDIINLEGNIIGHIGKNIVHAPLFIDVNPSTGFFYIGDHANAKIYVFDKNNSFLFDFGFPYLKTLSKICVDAEKKEIFVADKSEGNIFVFSTDGIFLRKFNGENMIHPHGLILHPKTSEIIVTDSGTRKAQLFDRNGILKKTLVFWGASFREFRNPKGICIKDNMICIANIKDLYFRAIT